MPLIARFLYVVLISESWIRGTLYMYRLRGYHTHVYISHNVPLIPERVPTPCFELNFLQRSIHDEHVQKNAWSL